MKNILICGVAKSGKSYLAKMINKDHKFNYIPLDYFTSSFKHNIPEAGITSDVVIDKESSKKLGLFLSRIMDTMDSIENEERYLIDSAHLYPRNIVEYVDRSKWDIYFLGYPNITVEDKFMYIRENVKGGWPAKRKDEELKETLAKLIEISKEIEEECKLYSVNFIDVSRFEDLDKFEID